MKTEEILEFFKENLYCFFIQNEEILCMVTMSEENGDIMFDHLNNICKVLKCEPVLKTNDMGYYWFEMPALKINFEILNFIINNCSFNEEKNKSELRVFLRKNKTKLL